MCETRIPSPRSSGRHGGVGAMLDAGDADGGDSMAVTEGSEGWLVRVAQLLRGRHRHGHGRLRVGAEGAVRVGPTPALRARSAPPQAETARAAQDHDSILEKIQADSAGGFLLVVSDGVSRGHGCLQGALGEVRAERGSDRVFLEVAAGWNAGVGIRTSPAKAAPCGSCIPTVPGMKQPPGQRQRRLRADGNAGGGSWGLRVVYKVNSCAEAKCGQKRAPGDKD